MSQPPRAMIKSDFLEIVIQTSLSVPEPVRTGFEMQMAAIIVLYPNTLLRKLWLP